MKRYLLISLLLFAATLWKIVTSVHTYCEARLYAAIFIIIAVMLGIMLIRRRNMGEVGAITLVVLVAAVVFNSIFLVMATKRCHVLPSTSRAKAPALRALSLQA